MKKVKYHKLNSDQRPLFAPVHYVHRSKKDYNRQKEKLKLRKYNDDLSD